MARVKDMTTNPEWSMVNNDKNFKQLDSLFTSVQDKCSADFAKEWMITGDADIKKKYSGECLYFELRKMVDDMNPVLKELDNFHSKLYRMRQASVDA
eukprot:10775754-Heterocapsa_arctica.AAC.1